MLFYCGSCSTYLDANVFFCQPQLKYWCVLGFYFSPSSELIDILPLGYLMDLPVYGLSTS